MPSGTEVSRLPTVGAIGEHALLARIRAALPPPPQDVVLGIGDDAAVVTAPRGRQLVLTTDALVDGVHFRRHWSSPEAIGRRAAAVNLSDLAAMGARPSHLLCSLLLPDDLPVSDVEALVLGLGREAMAHGAYVIGGNITRTPGPLAIDVTATGTVAPRRVITRAGARAGDELWMSGTAGSALAGLQMLQAGDAGEPALMARYLTPEPRLRLGQALAGARAVRAGMDLSDGLADGVRQLAAAAGLGALIDAEAVPLAPAARAWFRRTSPGTHPALAAIAGGDDYELLVAVPPKGGRRLRAALAHTSTPLTRIGVFTKAPALLVHIDGASVPLPGGFEHFRG